MFRKLASLLCLVVFFFGLLPATTAQDGIQAIVAYDNVNVRVAPDSASDSVGQLRYETSVTVHSREDMLGNGGMWVYVTQDALAGWVLSSLLRFPSDFTIEQLPVVSEIEVPHSPLDPDGSIQATVDTPGRGGQVNIRAEPSMRSIILDRFSHGTIVTVHYRSPDSAWYYINRDRMEGWVHGDYLAFSYGFDPAQLPVWQRQTVFDEPIIAEVAREVSIRLKPSRYATSLVSVPSGTQLLVQGQEDLTHNGGLWVFVTWQEAGVSGWVYYSFLRYPTGVQLPIGSPYLWRGHRENLGIIQLETYSLLQLRGSTLFDDPGTGYIVATYRDTWGARIRVEPNTDSPTIAYVLSARGRRRPYIFHGRTEAGDWVYLSFPNDSVSGWVGHTQGFAFPRDFDLMMLPVLPAIPDPPLPPARPRIASLPATTIRPLVVVENDAPLVLPAGTPIEVVGRDLLSRSYKVVVGDHEGWLPWDELNIIGDFNQLATLSIYSANGYIAAH